MRKSNRGKMNGSASNPVQKDSSRQYKGEQPPAILLVSVGVPEDERGKEVEARVGNALKDDCNTEESIMSIKGVSSLIPTLQKTDIETTGVFKSTYPCEGKDTPEKVGGDRQEDESFINPSGLGQALKMRDSEAHEGSRPTFPGTQELAKVTNTHNCKGPTCGKKVETLRTWKRRAQVGAYLSKCFPARRKRPNIEEDESSEIQLQQKVHQTENGGNTPKPYSDLVVVQQPCHPE